MDGGNGNSPLQFFFVVGSNMQVSFQPPHMLSTKLSVGRPGSNSVLVQVLAASRWMVAREVEHRASQTAFVRSASPRLPR